MALAYALAGPVGVNGIWAAIPIGWFLADAVGYGYYFLRRRALLPLRLRASRKTFLVSAMLPRPLIWAISTSSALPPFRAAR